MNNLACPPLKQIIEHSVEKDHFANIGAIVWPFLVGPGIQIKYPLY